MNPPPPARIALAAIGILAASTAIGAEEKKARSTDKHAASADESPLVLPTAIGELPDYLEKLAKRKPKNDAQILEDRGFKITALYNLGRFEIANDQYEKGIAHLREAVALNELMPHPTVWEYIHSEYIAATAAHGDFVEAVRVAKIILDRPGRTPGPEQPDALASPLALADTLAAKGERAAAASLYRRVLEVYEALLGPEHNNTLVAAQRLGIVSLEKGGFATAEPLFRRVLEARERTLGPEHPDTLDSVHNLAVLLNAKGDRANAEPLYRRALEGRGRTRGSEHSDTCDTAYSFALFYRDQKDFAKARPLAEQALKGWSKELGVEHPNTIAAKKLVDELKEKQ